MDAIAAAALVIGGSMLTTSPLGGYHHIVGEIMVVAGIFGTLIVWLGAWRRDQSRGQGRS